MRRLRLRKTLPRVARKSSRSSIIGAGSPIDAPRGYGAQTFALLHLPVNAESIHDFAPIEDEGLCLRPLPSAKRDRRAVMRSVSVAQGNVRLRGAALESPSPATYAEPRASHDVAAYPALST
jgi:hypothetical protein